MNDILMGCLVQTDIQYYKILDTIQKHNGKRNYTYYKCQCICGTIKDIKVYDYTNNKTVSCGCKTESGLIKEIPVGTRFGCLVTIARTKERSTEGYKYECLCDCGKTINTYYNRLKRGETKSCGCSSSKLNSLNNGGTGIPYETMKLQRAIRDCPKYRNFVKQCLERANNKSELSGKTDEKLCVHHLESVSHLIQRYQLTISTFMGCKELFSPSNAIVITESEHRHFHANYGHKCNTADWEVYKNK